MTRADLGPRLDSAVQQQVPISAQGSASLPCLRRFGVITQIELPFVLLTGSAMVLTLLFSSVKAYLSATEPTPEAQPDSQPGAPVGGGGSGVLRSAYESEG